MIQTVFWCEPLNVNSTGHLQVYGYVYFSFPHWETLILVSRLITKSKLSEVTCFHRLTEAMSSSGTVKQTEGLVDKRTQIGVNAV